jgi:transcriptional regulator with XRE-family HTH domain
LLRQLRAGARLTQEELAEAAGLSPRSVSDLERGINRTARKDTAVLLAGALGLAEPVRSLFVAAARGKAPAGEVLEAPRGQARGAAAATRTLPRDIAGFTGRQRELAGAGHAGRRGRRWRGGRHSRDRRDGRDRQDDAGGACRAPAGRRVPRWAVLLAAARPHAGPAASRASRSREMLCSGVRSIRYARPAQQAVRPRCRGLADRRVRPVRPCHLA